MNLQIPEEGSPERGAESRLAIARLTASPQ
jgi:hypothetical protein